MATLADLKTRIVDDMGRDDLDTGGEAATTLLRHIQNACETYASTRFWFNELITTAATTGGVQTVTVPATVRLVERVTIPAYYTDLKRVILANMDDDSDVQTIPSHYAPYNSTLRLWPTPDAAYTLRIYGLAQIDAPALDVDDNIWTNEAAELIARHTRMTLCRDVFADDSGFNRAAGAMREELDRLKRETARRMETPLRGHWGNAGFDYRVG